MKKTKVREIESVTEFELACNRLADLGLCEAGLMVERDEAVNKVKLPYQDKLTELAEQKAPLLEVCSRFAVAHKKTLFGENKSRQMVNSIAGFRTSPPRVEKVRSKATWADVALTLKGLFWGKAYLTTPEPSISKESILADRNTLTEEQLKDAGIRIVQDEEFFVRAKSEMAQAAMEAA